ncbi:MAG: hypothetical protein ACOCVP_07155 [Wenzhouxiangella sp.]
MNRPAAQTPAVGPILGATLVTDSLKRVLPCYAAIGLKPVAPAAWGRLASEPPTDHGHRSAWLAAARAEPWLRLLEIPGASQPPRFGRTGWFSLEVATNDVHRLAAIVLAAPGFEHLAGPAALDVSDHIIAMQVAGPSGELYYFTEVQRALPPFDLYRPTCLLDRLFIAVCTARSRSDTLAFWSQLSGIDGLSFETRINLLNRGLALAPDYRMPVATMQLAAGSLIEIDQIPEATPAPAGSEPGRAQGIAQISIAGESPRRLLGPDGESLEICRLGLDQTLNQ